MFSLGWDGGLTMDIKLINEKFALIEQDRKAVILQEVLEKHKMGGRDLSDVLLDVVNMAFIAGFEAAIESVIASFSQNTIE